jgi:hypothetical protein
LRIKTDYPKARPQTGPSFLLYTAKDSAYAPAVREKFPQGPKALAQAGYIYLNDSKCKDPECGALIHWYKTPSGQVMPIDSITKTPHFLSCPGAERFRKKKAKEKPAPRPDPQASLFQ